MFLTKRDLVIVNFKTGNTKNVSNKSDIIWIITKENLMGEKEKRSEKDQRSNKERRKLNDPNFKGFERRSGQVRRQG